MSDFRLHLPEPSEPPPDADRVDNGLQGSGSWMVKCPFCKHSWHGLRCRIGICKCNSANVDMHHGKEPDEYGRDDEPEPKPSRLPMVWPSDV